MEMAESKESSFCTGRDSLPRFGRHNETNPHYSSGYNLNHKTTAALNIKDPLVKMRANGSTSTSLRCHLIPEDAQHYDIGPLLSCMDEHESKKRPDMNRLSETSKNHESNASPNLLGQLQSSSAVLDDPNFQLTYSSVRKRPRSANIYVPHNQPVSEGNCIDDPAVLAGSLKRLCKEELERIIMGHMAGYVTTYKPYVDMEQELDSCKAKIERLRQKNDLLSKEVADLRIVVKSFVTQRATPFEPPTKRNRSVGVQAKPSRTADNVKFEENNFQEHCILKKCEKSRSSLSRERASVLHQPQVERNGELCSLAGRKGTNIPQKECKATERINERSRSMPNETENAKVEDDDLMVMFVKPSNPVPCCESLAEHAHSIPSSSTISEHPVEPILPKPVVTVTKTAENSIPAIRIAWEIPEKQRYAKAASYCVFLLKESRKGFRESWNPITGDISRMSCTFPMGRADKLRSSYQFKVRAIDIHGRHSPFSDVVVANFS